MRIFCSPFGCPEDQFPCFGNNIFRYFTLKILQHQYTKVEVFDESELQNPILVDDKFWKEYGKLMQQNKEIRIPELFDRDIKVRGYFQDDVMLHIEKEFLLSLFHEMNTDSIVEIPRHIRICDIVKAKNDETIDQNDIVVHLRLSDFKHYGGKDSEIIHPNTYFSVLDSIQFNRVILVIKPITEEFEKKYLDLFYKKYGDRVILHSSSELLQDFLFLKQCKRLIVSNSSFCWMAAYLGNVPETFVIRNRYHNHQKLDGTNENSQIVPIQYIMPSEIHTLSQE
jgi:hypothetical protein